MEMISISRAKRLEKMMMSGDSVTQAIGELLEPSSNKRLRTLNLDYVLRIMLPKKYVAETEAGLHQRSENGEALATMSKTRTPWVFVGKRR